MKDTERERQKRSDEDRANDVLRLQVDVLSPVEDLSYVISVFIQQLFQLIVRGKKKPFGVVLLGAAPVNGFSPPPRALTGPEPAKVSAII